MVYKCGKEITPHITEITNLCLVYICYDPNYNYDEADGEEMDTDEDGEDESEDEYSDDDDMSWKVGWMIQFNVFAKTSYDYAVYERLG